MEYETSKEIYDFLKLPSDFRVHAEYRRKIGRGGREEMAKQQNSY